MDSLTYISSGVVKFKVDPDSFFKLQGSLAGITKSFEEFAQAMSQQRKKQQQEFVSLSRSLVTVLGWRREVEGDEVFWLHASGYAVANDELVAPFAINHDTIACLCRFLRHSENFLLLPSTWQSFPIRLGMGTISPDEMFWTFDVVHEAMGWRVTIKKPNLIDMITALIGWCAADVFHVSQITGGSPSWLTRAPTYCDQIFDSSTGYIPDQNSEPCPCGSGATLRSCTCIGLRQFKP